MKKNNRGFMLAELLAVTVVIMVLFFGVYTAFMPTVGVYEQRIIYNDVPSTYTIFYLRKMYLEEDINLDKNYITLFDGKTCGNIKSENKNYCTKFAKESGVKELILTKFNLSDIKNEYEGELKDYIKYLPEYKNSTNKTEAWTIIPCSGKNCEQKDMYRKKTDGIWEKWNETACTLEENICEKSTFYKSNQDLYRLIIKTETGYATSPLYYDKLDDKIGPVCVWKDLNKNHINQNEEAIFTLTCLDNNEFYTSDITSTDLDIYDDNYVLNQTITIKDIKKEEQEFGYKYKITVSSELISHQTNIKLKLKANVLSDIFSNKNIGTEDSKTLTIN